MQVSLKNNGLIDLKPGHFYEVTFYSKKDDRTTETTEELVFYSKDIMQNVGGVSNARTYGFRFMNIANGDNPLSSWYRAIETEDIVSIKEVVPSSFVYTSNMSDCAGSNIGALTAAGSHVLEFDSYTL